MKKNHRIILSAFLLAFLSIINVNGQKWNVVDEKEITDSRSDLTRDIIPNKYLTYTVNINTVRNQLLPSPNRFKNNGVSQNVMNIPMPDGSIAKYAMTRSDVFHPDLAAKYPMIQSYTGTNISDPTSIIKLSISHKGINGMILSDNHPTVYIDRYAKEMDDAYIVYFKKDYAKHLHDGEGHCTVETPEDDLVPMSESAKYGDCQLRKYRLALACTGEYAAFHGGNIPDVLAEYNASMTRVNGIYEREFAITMELIANTDELIYLDASSDPYTNNSGSTMLGENQATIDDVIGFDNYDIGHVYSTGGGGIASLRSPCTTRKARGVTGLGNPTGDSFWVDYVAHEMGHQFGGNHSYNNSCNNNRNNSTAYEPGSGSTIMAYAGICSPNVQNNSDDYFHSISLEEVANFVVAGNGDCAETITIDNTAPELEPLFGGGLTLPISTPFELTAIASDADNDGITYCWEQRDNEIVDMPPMAENTGGPAFRSYNPSPSPTRYFPRLASILIGNNGNTWETLPSVNREMNFTVTVRDNNPLGGCTANDNLAIDFTDAAGPFLVTSQNATTTWNAGTQETVSWDVANTDAAPVSCPEVDIYLSLDGGENFDILLVEATTNDGEELITVPFQFSTTCRIMVKCASSIFLDVNDSDFSIAAPFSAIIAPTSVQACLDQVATYQIDYTEFDENIEVNFEVTNLPAGATATFSDNPITEDGVYDLSISDLQNVTPGEYVITVSAASPDLTLNQEVTLIVSPDTAPTIVTNAPTDAETNVTIFPTLSWEGNPAITQYEIELSNNPSFQNILISQTTSSPSASGFSLDVQTVYYWRVRALSPCFEAEWNTIQSFQTAGLSCLTTTEEANITIPEEEGSISSIITVPIEGDLSLTEITMTINHSYVGDLIGRLTSPSGTTITLFDQPGVPASDFGCGNDNLNLQFSDFALNTADDLEGTCTPGDFAIEGQFQPIGKLESLNGENMLGDWTLTIEDTYEDDGGELLEWSLTTCSSTFIESAVILNNNVLTLENETSKLLADEQLLVENMDSENVYYVLRSIPQHGNLQRFNHSSSLFENMAIGSAFTQYDIDQGDINYSIVDLSEDSDQFLFDVVDNQFRYLANQVFNISYSFEGLIISTEITNEINCFGDIDGEITANASGGVAPLTYSIDGENYVDSPIFSGLNPGSYTISVKDAAGVVIISNLTDLLEPAELQITLISNENEITINADGGTGDIEYSIDGVSYSTTNVFELENGSEYTPSVRDANGCLANADSFIHYYISTVGFTTSDVSCNGLDDGTLTVTSVVGGLSPYTYSINDESNDSGIFTDLPPGMHVLEVSDSAGNINTLSFEITEPTLLEIFTTVNQDTIFVEGAGGVEPYLYSLDGELYQDLNFLIGEVGETYTVYIIDQTGCVTTVDGIEIISAVSNPTLDALKLYPNPTSNSFQFGSQSSVNLSYEIMDVTGRLILSGQTTANRLIDISMLSEGLFICKVKADGGEKSFRLIVID